MSKPDKPDKKSAHVAVITLFYSNSAKSPFSKVITHFLKTAF